MRFAEFYRTFLGAEAPCFHLSTQDLSHSPVICRTYLPSFNTLALRKEATVATKKQRCIDDDSGTVVVLHC